jgi:predicted Zn finger-like uncharacterized protein
MYTRCPHCLTVFPLEPATLALGRGRLCCGACGLEFDALERLAERPEALAVDDLPAPARPPRIDPPTDPAQPDLFAATLPGAPAAVAPARAAPPSFARQHRAQAAGHRLAWGLSALLLALGLGAQIIIAQRDELAADPRWRAWLEPACERLGCRLPAWRDPATVSLTAREISPHPSLADALLVSATLRNDAPWPQAWPLLQLALSDLDGNALGLRRFTAEEYLGGTPAQPTLGPGQSAVARLEIADPGKQAVAFAFDFH